jgi:hypothetical protein
MEPADGAGTLAAMSVEDLEDLLLVGGRVGCRWLEYLVVAEILALHAKRPFCLDRVE